MKLLITSLLALLAAILIGVVLTHDPGLVVLDYGGWTMQTSAGLFVFGVLLTVVVLYLLLRFVGGVLHLPKDLRRWSAHRRLTRSEKYLADGLLCMVEGNWRMAERAFRRGARYSHAPTVNYLCAARAAQQQGDLQRRDQYLRLAHELDQNSALAVGLTQAELQLHQHQTEQAYATLNHLSTEHPDQDQVRRLMLEASRGLREWTQVLKLLDELDGKDLVSPERLRQLRLDAYAGLLHDAGGNKGAQALQQQWREIPRALHREPSLLTVYVAEYLRFGDDGECEEMLRSALKHNWDADLVRFYGLVRGRDGVRQLGTAEKWLSAHPRDPVLLLTLGRICLHNDLWGKARTYMEDSVAVQPSPEAYRELAALLERRGEKEAAAGYYQKGLLLATGSGHARVPMLERATGST